MFKTLVSILVGIIAGFALAIAGPSTSIVDDDGHSRFLTTAGSQSSCNPDTDLEAALLLERDATQRLLHEIDSLEAEIDSLSAVQPVPDSPGSQAWFVQAWEELAVNESEVDRQQQLVDGGFAPARADWIVQRESELQQAVVDGRDGTMPLDQLEIRMNARQSLRDEIGDYEYEQYLAATGQSTVVAVTQVIPDSAAARGGLKAGDEIIDYDGARVFNVFELSDAASAGSPGDTVIVNIERDGAPMQLVLPRGTLGIGAGKPRRYSSSGSR